MDLKPPPIASFGRNTDRGNLVAIQPSVAPDDYGSVTRLSRKLDGYFAAAQKQGFIGRKTVAILPEYLGTGLVVAGEKRAVLHAPTMQEALQAMAMSRRASFAGSSADARDALFRMKAADMVAAYQRIFSRLARAYRVTLVAGSILLPSPRVERGGLIAGTGPLYNASVVYAPDGRARSPEVRKVFLTDDERPFVSAGLLEDLPVFDTPAGRLGVLVCADSWYPQAYEVLRRRGAELIAVPSFLASRVSEDPWSRIWEGYQGETPADVTPADVGKLTEGEAWLKYALAGRLRQGGARAGVNVFLSGRLWEINAGGRTTAVSGDRVSLGPGDTGPAIVNLWLERPGHP